MPPAVYIFVFIAQTPQNVDNVFLHTDVVECVAEINAVRVAHRHRLHKELVRAPGLDSAARSMAAATASLLVASSFVSNTTTFGALSPVPKRSSALWFAS